METYNVSYKFVKSEINYRAEIKGTIFESENNINCYHEADLNKGVSNHIIEAVLSSLSENKSGLFINNKSTFMCETKLMQSNANEHYAVMIDSALYPISLNVDIIVENFVIDLLK